jgi:hypothetical protein
MRAVALHPAGRSQFLTLASIPPDHPVPLMIGDPEESLTGTRFAPLDQLRVLEQWGRG